MRLAKFVVLLACSTMLLTVSALGQTAPAPPAKSAASTASYDGALLKPSLLKETAPDTYQVKFETTRGDFTVTVTRAWAPLAADRFYNLVKHGYYSGARFFRVIPGFVVQFGISAYPQVTAAWQKATIKDEPVSQKNLRGTLTFAKTSMPNSRTVEIFINLKDNLSLDSQGFAPFGKVDTNGMNVVEMLYDQYGDSAGMDQEPMEKGGEKYISTKWPKLDTIKSVSLVGGAASTPTKPVAKPASGSKAAGTAPKS